MNILYDGVDTVKTESFFFVHIPTLQYFFSLNQPLPIIIVITSEKRLENRRSPSGNIFMFMDYIVIFTPRPFISLLAHGNVPSQ